jgi:hypothetical protein
VTPKQDKRPDEPAAEADTPQRRRIGRIVRDDRDSATVEWVEAPANHHRVPLSIEKTLPPGGIKPASGYDPYETVTPQRADKTDKRPAKRDLRKLSEWIKQMRELEDRKKRGED